MKRTRGLAGLAAILTIAACAGGAGLDATPQNREALSNQMLKQDTLSSGFIPGNGPVMGP